MEQHRLRISPYGNGCTQEKVYTIDDIYALPEGERAELIDGHIYYTAPPNRTHQKISMELSARILEYIRSHKGKCEVYAAPFAALIIQFIRVANH